MGTRLPTDANINFDDVFNILSKFENSFNLALIFHNEALYFGSTDTSFIEIGSQDPEGSVQTGHLVNVENYEIFERAKFASKSIILLHTLLLKP